MAEFMKCHIFFYIITPNQFHIPLAAVIKTIAKSKGLIELAIVSLVSLFKFV